MRVMACSRVLALAVLITVMGVSLVFGAGVGERMPDLRGYRQVGGGMFTCSSAAFPLHFAFFYEAPGHEDKRYYDAVSIELSNSDTPWAVVLFDVDEGTMLGLYLDYDRDGLVDEVLESYHVTNKTLCDFVDRLK